MGSHGEVTSVLTTLPYPRCHRDHGLASTKELFLFPVAQGKNSEQTAHSSQSIKVQTEELTPVPSCVPRGMLCLCVGATFLFMMPGLHSWQGSIFDGKQ